MTVPRRSIFRKEAMDHYIREKEESVLPKIASPRFILFLWVLFILFASGVCIVWSIPVPVYSSGYALVTDKKPPFFRNKMGKTLLVIIFPPEIVTRLKKEQIILVEIENNQNPLIFTIAHVEPVIFSPGEATDLFPKNASSTQIIQSPVAVAYAKWRSPNLSIEEEKYVGSVFPVKTQTGSRNPFSYLPVVGEWFCSND